jgi:pilus assembly protein CpaF
VTAKPLLFDFSGLPGICTIHANSAREAVTKMCALPLLAGENVGHAFVVPTVASSVDLVVHTRSDTRGHRRVGEIVAVPGRVEGTGDGGVIEIEDAFTSRKNRFVRVDGFPPHAQRFEEAGFNLVELLAQERYDAARAG